MYPPWSQGAGPSRATALALTDGEVPYVERLAERIAGFPETAVRIAERRINAAGLPPKEDVHVDSGFFQPLARDPSTMARIRAPDAARDAGTLPRRAGLR
ncbi:hypothetical protein GCM10014715_59280 [Streptomyces spiralis]|uniref:Uncharacterized protein n=1 Tax=Streptomyces spiralis TaxID=66376 RepID=A0A919AAB8_9ACTN|nr:hypothetical protein GCM10014715_59280 [Streptomyces spiralis]